MSCDVGKAAEGWRMSCDVGETMLGFGDNPYIASPTSQLILQLFCCFTYVTAHSTALPLLHLRHRHLTYFTALAPTLLLLYLHHSSFYNPSVASPTLQAPRLCHSSFSNPSAASSTPQLILQPFCCFAYITGTSRTSPGEPPMHRGMKKQAVADQLVTASY